jgi:transcriptional regulator with XRE-family HTH domain
MTAWRSIVRELMRERKISARALCRLANVNRSTFVRFMTGKSERFQIDNLESVLKVLGYELDAVLKGKPEPEKACRASKRKLVIIKKK